MSIVVLITAAGRGSRFKSDIPKQYLPLAGVPILRHTIMAFLNHKEIDNLAVIINKEDINLYEEATIGLDLLPPILGGETRQQSVKNGLDSLINLHPEKILIHDAVRPFVTKTIISGIIKQLETSSAVIPALAVDDTIKQCADGKILWTVERNNLWRAQTPQGFIYKEILKYHSIYKDITFTDDAALNEYAGIPVTIIPGSQNNFKITTKEDYKRAQAIVASKLENITKETRIGIGFDIHRFDTNQRLNNNEIKLGGSLIPHPFPIIGHSDGDPVIHSIVDGIFGAIGEGDIGTHFPDNDEKWKNTDSAVFLKYASNLMHKKGGKIVNIDLTIICEKPKISPYRKIITKKLAEILGIKDSRINVKAKTTEKLGLIGKGEGIAAQVVVNIAMDVVDEEEY